VIASEPLVFTSGLFVIASISIAIGMGITEIASELTDIMLIAAVIALGPLAIAPGHSREFLFRPCSSAKIRGQDERRNQRRQSSLF
jgi:hypothetical protein